uniref:MI domain-containing protein n=1 Tax=Caenorhabditis tropicalis TaxID=1561998 RepID=A0A1I7TME1_9PELO
MKNIEDWQMAKGKGQNQGQDHSFRQQQKQMLDPRPSAKQPEADKGQSSGSRVADLKNWSNEFSIATSPKEMSPAPGHTPPAPQGNSGSAWNRGPPSSLVAKGSTTETVSPSTENNVPVSETSKTATQKKEEVPSTSGGEAQNESDAPQEDRDDVSVTDRSETSSVITTKSSSFKFNINAPEFKPRVAPSTPTPTTPTGPTPQNMNHIPQQHHQYIPPASQYQQPMIPQGQPMGVAGMVPHMGPGGIPQNQGHVVAWQQGQQSYPQSQQFQMQQVTMQGVPGQMYGPAATAPTSVSQAAPINQQIPTSTSGGPPTDGNQINAPARREGEYREAQPMFYSYPQAPMVQVPQQFYHQQYQGAVPQPYQMKVMPQGPQGAYQPRFQQPYMIPQGQNPQQIIQGPPQQAHQFAGEQVAPQSHPNSQPTTPGPRGEMNGPKNQQGPPQAQNGNNGMHREPEAGSNASLSGSASSQSGQRSGSPQTNAPVQQQQHQQAPTHSGLQHGGPPHATGPPPHMMQQPQFMIVPHQMHSQIPNYYQQQQQMYYSTMMVPQQMHMQPNQHGQQSLMGERADTGYAHNNIFDYRKMPNYQQNQQQSHNQQMHGGHMPRQNSIPQQYGATQSTVRKEELSVDCLLSFEGVNSSSQQAPPTASQQQQQQQQQGGPPREQQQQSQPSQPQAQSPQ